MSLMTNPTPPNSARKTLPIRSVAVAGAALALVVGAGGIYAARRAHAGGLLAFLSQGTGDLGRMQARGRQLYISMGTVANNSGAGGDDVRGAAQSGIQEALASSSGITTTPPSASASRGARTVVRGHVFDANVQSIRPGNNSVRIQVSIVVSTYPGREYEFESSSAITITGGSATTPAAQADGVRTAMRSATQRALQQLEAGVP
jgi:hypothetical protein